MQRFTQSFRFAWQGLVRTWRHEGNFKIQVTCAVLVAVAAAVLQVARYEALVLVLTIGLVLVLELVNSSLENLADAVHPHFSLGVKYAKDAAAAAVFMSSLIALGVGVITFWPHVISLVGTI